MNIGLTQRDIWRFMKVYFAAPLKDILKQEQGLLSQAEAKATKSGEKNDSKIVVISERNMSAHYFNPQEMINKTIIFDERPAASVASSFHVAYGIDKNFLFGCGVFNHVSFVT